MIRLFCGCFHCGSYGFCVADVDVDVDVDVHVDFDVDVVVNVDVHVDASVDVDVDHADVDVYETAMLVCKVINMGDKVVVEDDNHPRESKQFQ